MIFTREEAIDYISSLRKLVANTQSLDITNKEDYQRSLNFLDEALRSSYYKGKNVTWFFEFVSNEESSSMRKNIEKNPKSYNLTYLESDLVGYWTLYRKFRSRVSLVVYIDFPKSMFKEILSIKK